MPLPRRPASRQLEGADANYKDNYEDDSSVYEEMQSFVRNKSCQNAMPPLVSRKKGVGMWPYIELV